MEIRKSTETDKSEIEALLIRAFGEEDGPVITKLVNDLVEDETANPLLSLVAVQNSKIVGHILFTNATLTQTSHSVSAQLLAPLAVLPNAQNQGIGTQLIKEGLRQLKESGVELVFVLGHPDYYPRCGFVTAGVVGLQAPYPIPKIDSGAWMVQELKESVIENVKGKVQCAQALNHPELWCE